MEVNSNQNESASIEIKNIEILKSATTIVLMTTVVTVLKITSCTQTDNKS